MIIIQNIASYRFSLNLAFIRQASYFQCLENDLSGLSSEKCSYVIVTVLCIVLTVDEWNKPFFYYFLIGVKYNCKKARVLLSSKTTQFEAKMRLLFMNIHTITR